MEGSHIFKVLELAIKDKESFLVKEFGKVSFVHKEEFKENNSSYLKWLILLFLLNYTENFNRLASFKSLKISHNLVSSYALT